MRRYHPQKEKTPYKDGYTFNGWQNEPSTMPGYDVTVNGTFNVNTYHLSFIVDNEELETKNVEYGTSITAPTKDGEGNNITWYTYPATMPAHDVTVTGSFFKKGDANGDNRVNAVDIVEVVNAMNGKASTKFILSNVDSNNNGKADADDIKAIVNIIMNPNK